MTPSPSTPPPLPVPFAAHPPELSIVLPAPVDLGSLAGDVSSGELDELEMGHFASDADNPSAAELAELRLMHSFDELAEMEGFPHRDPIDMAMRRVPPELWCGAVGLEYA